MNERLQLMGRLEERRMEAKKLKLRMEGLRDSIRSILLPLENLEEINLAVVSEQADELAQLQLKLREALTMIAAIRKALGE